MWCATCAGWAPQWSAPPYRTPRTWLCPGPAPTRSIRSGRERLHVAHGDLDVGAAGSGVGHGLARPGPQDGAAERGLRTVNGQVGGSGDLPGPEQEGLGVVGVVVEVDGDHSAGCHGTGGRAVAHSGVTQQVLQVPDPRLLLALLLLGGMVAAVFPQVAFLPAGVDLRRDDRPVGDQLVELGLEAVVSLLGEPDGRLAICGHGQSPPLTA